MSKIFHAAAKKKIVHCQPLYFVNLQNDSKTPQVASLVVRCRLSLESIHNLRGHIFSWTNLQKRKAKNKIDLVYNITFSIKFVMMSYILCPV